MNTLPPSSFFTELLEMDQSSKGERQAFVRGLARVEEKDVAPGKPNCNLAFLDDTCAICQETFLAIIATEEMASVMETPGLPEEDLGLVKLPGCGHRFCRKDIATWVYSSHSTCPACRNEFLPESMRQAVHDEPGLDSLLEARELIRLLQLRTAGMYDNADEARHNPFNEGGAGVSAPSLDGDEREDLQRIVDQFQSVFGAPAPRRDDRDDYAGMYS